MNKIFLLFFNRNIRRHFGFLFQKGYEIRKTGHDFKDFGDWRAVLESLDCLIVIYQDRDEIFLAFAPRNGGQQNLIGIEPMIYFISHGNTFVGWYDGNLAWDKRQQFERLARLLEEHLDQITPYFGIDYRKYANDLTLAQKNYNNLLLEKYSSRQIQGNRVK